MSPTADDYSKEIGRDIQVGDVFVERDKYLYSGSVEVRYWEVVNPNVTGYFPKIKNLFGFPLLTRETEKIPSLELRELTPYGKSETTVMRSRAKMNWGNMIRVENRSEGPITRERSR